MPCHQGSRAGVTCHPGDRVPILVRDPVGFEQVRIPNLHWTKKDSRIDLFLRLQRYGFPSISLPTEKTTWEKKD